MIGLDKNPVEWTLLLLEMDEANEHLEDLMAQMAKEKAIDEEDFRVQHVSCYHPSKSHLEFKKSHR